MGGVLRKSGEIALRFRARRVHWGRLPNKPGDQRHRLGLFRTSALSDPATVGRPVLPRGLGPDCRQRVLPVDVQFISDHLLPSHQHCGGVYDAAALAGHQNPSELGEHIPDIFERSSVVYRWQGLPNLGH